MRRVASLASCLPSPTLIDRFTSWMISAPKKGAAVGTDGSGGGALAADLRMFALTYAAGFFAVSLFIA